MIAVVYGSSSDNTKDAAIIITDKLREQMGVQIDLIDVATIKNDISILQSYLILLVGSSTWNIGELQDDWYDAFPQLDSMDMSSTIVALFGCGDQQNFPDNFVDAIGILGHKLRERGASMIGRWSTEGYDFSESQAVEDGMFMGLALDENNQPKLTPARIDAWIEQLVTELQIEVDQRAAAS
ncbi:MAG: flavodoxin [Oscillochloris sp.]|nr:flavodoxin [Oscillochloris sp.]